MTKTLVLILVSSLFVTLLANNAGAAESGCGQKLVDGTTPPTTTSYIYPRVALKPFYQWENNDGYCGEVSMMEAGLNNGQWMSQFNARLICGTGLSQSGPNGACAAHKNQVNYNAQLLIEDPGTGVSGPNTYANAALCLSNSQLSATTYSYSAQSSGIAGYEQYMSWVKQQVIDGHQVTVAVLLNGGTDPQYDHEVAVIKLGTNHSPTDATYYSDDVFTSTITACTHCRVSNSLRTRRFRRAQVRTRKAARLTYSVTRLVRWRIRERAQTARTRRVIRLLFRATGPLTLQPAAPAMTPCLFSGRTIMGSRSRGRKIQLARRCRLR